MTSLADRLGISAIAVVVYQLPYCAYAFWSQKDTFTDFAGSTAFAVGAWLTLWHGDAFYPRQIILATSITLWTGRLAGFLLKRVIKHGKEARMDGIRENPVRFAVFWTLQALWSWLGVLPLALSCSSAALAAPGAFEAAHSWQGWTDAVAIVCWVGGIAIEAVADEQRLQYTLTRTEPTSLCTRGIWRWSRHPNYFGEIMLWLGYSLGCLPLLWPVMRQQAAVGLYIGAAMPPVFTALLLIGLSGMPLGERYHAKRMNRLGAWPLYADYLARTSPLVPLPPAIYRRLPTFIKRYVFLALPKFERRPSSADDARDDGDNAVKNEGEKERKQD